MIKINKFDVITISLSCLAGMIIGAGYTQLAYISDDVSQGSIWIGVGIGGLIGLFISAFEALLVGKPYSYIRRLPFLPALIIRVFVHVEIIYLSVRVVKSIYTALTGIDVDVGDTNAESLSDLAFSFVILTAIIFYMQMRLFIGGTTLRNLIVGKYHRPQTEDRIFLILDVVGSTSLAQKIGDEAFHKYLNEIFVLVDDPIHKHGGEIHSYVGDAAFAVWRSTSSKDKNGRALQAMKDIHQAVQFNGKKLEAKYGIRPQVRMALHRGSVIIGETGYRKRQITFLGNTVNLVSRMEELTKTGIGTYLVSQDFLEDATLPEGLKLSNLGAFEIKGSDKSIELSAVTVA